MSFIDLTNLTIPKELGHILPRSISKKYSLVPVSADNDEIHIAMADPRNFVAIDEVKLATKRKVVPMLSTVESINRAINDLYGSETAEKAIQDLKSSAMSDETKDFQGIAATNIVGADNENAAPTIRLVNSFLEYAVNQGCSDIHLCQKCFIPRCENVYCILLSELYLYLLL